MSDSSKFCKDCKHYRTAWSWRAGVDHLCIKHPSPVTGVAKDYCTGNRAYNSLCGESAAWFEQREQSVASIAWARIVRWIVRVVLRL